MYPQYESRPLSTSKTGWSLDWAPVPHLDSEAVCSVRSSRFPIPDGLCNIGSKGKKNISGLTWTYYEVSE